MAITTEKIRLFSAFLLRLALSLEFYAFTHFALMASLWVSLFCPLPFKFLGVCLLAFDPQSWSWVGKPASYSCLHSVSVVLAIQTPPTPSSGPNTVKGPRDVMHCSFKSLLSLRVRQWEYLKFCPFTSTTENEQRQEVESKGAGFPASCLSHYGYVSGFVGHSFLFQRPHDSLGQATSDRYCIHTWFKKLLTCCHLETQPSQIHHGSGSTTGRAGTVTDHLLPFICRYASQLSQLPYSNWLVLCSEHSKQASRRHRSFRVVSGTIFSDGPIFFFLKID